MYHWRQYDSHQDQIAAVQNFPQPNTVKELQAFLGAMNFYRWFIFAASKILLPLTTILKGGRKRAVHPMNR